MLRVRSRNAYQHVFEFNKGLIVAYRNCDLPNHSIAARVGRDPMIVSGIGNRWVQDDVSPIANVWSVVAERLARHHTPVTTVYELLYRVEATWSSIPMHAIQSLTQFPGA
ncbi:hypothetical protein TNCV_4910831 [Trichonephila clavipes]|nr:hypothetical protein TNCV_4910831 [Trichonephila clavipes]